MRTHSRIAVIGLGMIGGSVARAIKKHGLAAHVSGYDSNAETVKKALELGVVNSAHSAIAAAVIESDIVILCAPPGATASLVEAMTPHLKSGAILTDVGSVKARIMQEVEQHLPAYCNFVPGHPIAGSEQAGMEAGSASLFEDKQIILTPPQTDAPTVAVIRHMWEGMGGRVEILDAEAHDRIFAITSHLPHLLAFTLAATLSAAMDAPFTPPHEHFLRCVRIGASNPRMWSDVFLYNRKYLMEFLPRILDRLQRFISSEDMLPLVESSFRFRRAADKNRSEEWPETGLLDVSNESLATHVVPAVLAHAFVGMVSEIEAAEHLPLHHYLGGGFMDFTRPALTPPALTMEMLKENLGALTVSGLMDGLQIQIENFMADIAIGEDMVDTLTHARECALRLRQLATCR